MFWRHLPKKSGGVRHAMIHCSEAADLSFYGPDPGGELGEVCFHDREESLDPDTHPHTRHRPQHRTGIISRPGFSLTRFSDRRLYRYIKICPTNNAKTENPHTNSWKHHSIRRIREQSINLSPPHAKFISRIPYHRMNQSINKNNKLVLKFIFANTSRG